MAMQGPASGRQMEEKSKLSSLLEDHGRRASKHILVQRVSYLLKACCRWAVKQHQACLVRCVTVRSLLDTYHGLLITSALQSSCVVWSNCE